MTTIKLTNLIGLFIIAAIACAMFNLVSMFS